MHRDAANILDAAFDGDTNPSVEEVAMADTAAPPQIKRSLEEYFVTVHAWDSTIWGPTRLHYFLLAILKKSRRMKTLCT